MLLYIRPYQDGTFPTSAVIDYATSVIWIKRFNSPGEFELYIRATTELFELFSDSSETIVTRDDNDTVMIVENISLTTDVENGDYLTIRGRSAESIIGRRIFPKQMNYSGKTEVVIRQMLLDHIISPSINRRKIDLLRLGTLNGWEETITKQVTGKNLLETISDICVAYNYGFKLTFRRAIFDGELADRFDFNLYKGTDRSYNQNDNTWVIFSPTFENLGNTEYSRDLTTYYNSVYVAGQGEGANRVIVGNNSGKSGLFLREKWVDARQTSKETSDGELSENEYREILIEQSKEELELAKETTVFSGEILTPNSYVYGVDYNLGDKVQIVNEYGIKGTATITEITEVEDENGYKIYPTLSEWSV